MTRNGNNGLPLSPTGLPRCSLPTSTYARSLLQANVLGVIHPHLAQGKRKHIDAQLMERAVHYPELLGSTSTTPNG